MLAQRACNAWIEGVLTYEGMPIEGTEFFLECICGLPEPQPLGQFVFWKVPTDVVPTDIEYMKYIDIDKDGVPDIVEPISGLLTFDDPTEPHTWYQHLEEGDGPFGPWMVVVEVREQPYHEDRPFFEWQLTMKTHGLPLGASLSGVLTKDEVVVGTEFNLITTEGVDPDLQCQVVRTKYCTVPNDIHLMLTINGMPPSIDINATITQFPWKYTYVVDPPFVYVDLELTEVQMYHYTIMGGVTTSDGQLGTFDPWFDEDPNGSVPFATRAPYMTPLLLGQNITFTQRDPITGIVKLGVPWQSYDGLDHIYYSERVGTYFNVRIFLETQGCGWLFTGIGKDPILGAVDYDVYNNNTGVYTSLNEELLAGPVDITHPAYEAAGAGKPIGPCLQELRGFDDIPGTPDDPIGRGDPDGPNPPGSSLMYLPTNMLVTYWDGVEWLPLFGSPWPQLLTTGTATDTVIETASDINGESTTVTGEPWEFLAGLDHPGQQVSWKHEKCNAYVTYVCCWSVMDTFTALGDLDVRFHMIEKKVRDDCVIADIDCNELVDIVDIVITALAFGALDEGFGNPVADPNFDARGDLSDARGEIDIVDIVRIAINFGWQLTPNCIITPYSDRLGPNY
jgi:hypothetical protein